MNTAAPKGRVAIVYHPGKVELDELKAAVAAAVDKHGWGEVEWWETTKDDPGEGPAREAVARGATMVVACGGDGTVRAAATGLRDTGASLGVIPLGTGNLLARNLKLPLNMEEAVDAVFGGQDAAIDLCTAAVTRPDGSSERFDFVVMAGVGVDAQMIVNTDDELKRKVGFLAYGVAIAKSLAGGNRIRAEYRIDGGQPEKTRVHSLIGGNCGELVGGLPLLPDAQANDGIFDLVFIRPTGVFGWAQIAGRLIRQAGEKVRRRLTRSSAPVTGGAQDLSSLRYLSGTHLEATLKHPEVFEVDGEEIGQVTAFNISIDPGGLVVCQSSPPPVEEPGEVA
ncbi:Diacylglycerol kinase [Corynebacterium atrinae]|uniref:diacylglycerol/lipid kinase family protein n=1 Tax=Corynebacterium atrinae TaxID=1336740 RepID=UPI0025B2A57A|nr:diacylglycerol kinase family protein [Corynebacterium atrinae]WJY63321.1 Diacylglycerol kinase [Corynebacterium atrinae]